MKGKKIRKPKFNPSQQQVIDLVQGPLLVDAVAGAGKTTVLTHRIKKMINVHNIDPNTILATTFTKKAADEMNNKLKNIGVDVNEMRVSTFHSACYYIIRQEIRDFSRKYILDANGMYEKNTLKEVLGYKNMNWEKADIGEVAKTISLWKNNLISTDKAEHQDPRFVRAYYIFEQLRKEKGFVTFDDLLYMCYVILSTNEEIRKKWQSKYEYILIDECQDNNTCQHELAKLLTYPENNIMIVGDIDQSIYKFRGAVPQFMLKFVEEFNATIIRMEDNYRCKQQIINAANLLISFNKIRFEKKLICNTGNDGRIEINSCFDQDEEAAMVKDKILELIKDGSQYKDIAILYRTNAQSRSIEDQMISEGIPYELVGGINFYNRKEVKDILAYVRAALNIDNYNDEFKRIINVPFRYLGRVFTSTIEDMMSKYKYSYEEALTDVPSKRNQRQSIDDFLSIINTIRYMIENNISSEDLLQYIVDRINYIDYLKKEDGESEEENSRILNIRELTRASSKFNNIAEFLDYIKKMQKKREKNEPQANKVILSTIHRSKGLEWPVVFIIGVNEGIMPNARNIEIIDGVETCEEERRLMYVATTRAKESLFISYNDTYDGKVVMPSRFIKEMELEKI